jgi:hypothetical protein
MVTRTQPYEVLALTDLVQREVVARREIDTRRRQCRTT